MRIVDKNITYGTKISEHIWKDNNGQLICNDCVLARTGAYDYRESEIIPDGDYNKIVKVYRKDSDVFDPKAMASFENKPFCNEHPQEDVNGQNYKKLQYGFLRDVHRGEGSDSNCLMGTLVVTDSQIIDLILSGEKRELSLGYDTNIVQDPNGNYYMTQIRGNHIALVDSGRAGCATIRDSNIKNLGGAGMSFRTKKVRLSDALKEKLFNSANNDEDTVVEVEEKVDEDGNKVLVPCECNEPEPEVVEVEEVEAEDDDVIPQVESVNYDSKLDTIIDLLQQLISKFDVIEEPVVEQVDEDTVQEPVQEPKKEEPVQDNENVLYDEDEDKDKDKEVEVEIENNDEPDDIDTDGDELDEDDEEDDEDEDGDTVIVKDSANPYSKLVKNKDSDTVKTPSYREIWQARFDANLKKQQ